MPQYFHSFLLDILRLSIWLALIVVVLVPLERLFALHPQKFCRKEFLTDLSYYFINNLFPKLLLVLPLAVLAWCLHFVIPVEFLKRVAALPAWIRLGGALIVGDIGFYWGHRWAHEIPVIWRFHAIHHSAEQMDWLVNTRAHPVDILFTRLCGYIPMYVLGLAQPVARSVDPVSFLVLFIGVAWGFFIHANIRWRFGPLEWLVATPAFHHWHHTYSGPINKNYAAMLPFIDLMFGTYHWQRQSWPERYGTETEVPSGLTHQIIAPLLPQPSKAPIAPLPPSTVIP